ncbi:hypothetical protein Tco_0546738 [Tanacetum coccineum]
MDWIGNAVVPLAAKVVRMLFVSNDQLRVQMINQQRYNLASCSVNYPDEIHGVFKLTNCLNTKMILGERVGRRYALFILLRNKCVTATSKSDMVNVRSSVVIGNHPNGEVNPIADETIHKEREDRIERAATTASSLEAEQDSDAQTRFETASIKSNDPPLSRVNTLGSGEDNMKLMELMEFFAFLDKPEEGAGFEEIVDFLNASHIKYALTVNPTVYESCIQQLWATAKVKTINEERQIQALVDKKKVIVTETSTRHDLKLDDAEGTDCLSNDVIFEQLSKMGTMASAIIYLATNQKFNFSKYIFDNMVKHLEGGVKILLYPRFVQVFLNKQVEGMSQHTEVYVTSSHTKKFFANMKREGKGFSGHITPLFATMMVQAHTGEDSDVPTDSHLTPDITQPSSSKPQKKKSRRKQRKDSGPTEPVTEEATTETHVSTPSYDTPLSGEDIMQLIELRDLCTKISDRVLALETTKSNQALEIESLKRRVKKLEKKVSKKTYKLKRLYKDLDGMKVYGGLEKKDLISTAKSVTTAGEVVTTVSALTTTIEELTLAQTLIEIKAAKPKTVTTVITAATTITTAITTQRAKGIVFHEQEQTHIPTVSSQQPTQKSKDKGKAIMVEPERPLKRKDQVAADEELAR